MITRMEEASTFYNATHRTPAVRIRLFGLCLYRREQDSFFACHI
jgi:hypothetical protein